MRNVFAIIVLTVVGTTAQAAPLEDDAVYSHEWTRDRAQELADEAAVLIVRTGYRCDTISSIRAWMMSAGFTVFCNGFRYEYEIEDRGGRWTVTLQ